VILVCACAAGESREPIVFSDSAGIRIALNDHRRPGWNRTDVWVLRDPPRIQLGNVPGDPDQELYRVAHSRRLQDGRIVVANTGVGDVRIYGLHGELLQKLRIADRSSAGPAPVHVEQLGTDSLLVVTGDGSVVIFDRDGNQVARFRLATPGAEFEGGPEIVGAFRDGTLLARAHHADDPAATGVGRRQVRLLRYAATGQLLGSFGDFGDQTVLYGAEGGYIFGPSGQYAAADSTIWYTSGDRYEAREVAPGGRTLRIIRLDRPGSMVRQADIFTYRSAAKRQVAGTADEATIDATLEASVFADTFPAFDQLHVDATGDVWLRNYRWFHIGTSQSWSVFDPTGRYLGEVRTPPRLEVHQIGADFLLGRLSNRRGAEAVYLWDLEKPGAAAGNTARPG
jgi:hypothetical protein